MQKTGGRINAIKLLRPPANGHSQTKFSRPSLRNASRKQGFNATPVSAPNAFGGDGCLRGEPCGAPQDGRRQAATAANVSAGRLFGVGLKGATANQWALPIPGFSTLRCVRWNSFARGMSQGYSNRHSQYERGCASILLAARGMPFSRFVHLPFPPPLLQDPAPRFRRSWDVRGCKAQGF